MEINGKEFGVCYDQLTIVSLCEELGLEYIDDLQVMFNKAFGEGKATVATIKIQIAIVLACLNRWCERNDKDYRISKNEVVDMDSEILKEVITEIFAFISKNTPKGEKKK